MVKVDEAKFRRWVGLTQQQYGQYGRQLYPHVWQQYQQQYGQQYGQNVSGNGLFGVVQQILPEVPSTQIQALIAQLQAAPYNMIALLQQVLPNLPERGLHERARRLHPYFALEFGYAQTAHNPVEDPSGYNVSFLALHALTVDAKIIFPNRSNVRPYVQAGVGYYILTHEYQDAVSGGGIQLGGGIDIWLNPWWSLGGRVLYHGIKFAELGSGTTTGKPFLSTASLDLNLQVHF